MGIFLAANWALIIDIVPRSEAARYLGVANIATAGGSAPGRIIGGALIDPTDATAHSQSAGYLHVYGITGVFFLAAAVTVPPLPSPVRAVTAGAVPDDRLDGAG